MKHLADMIHTSASIVSAYERLAVAKDDPACRGISEAACSALAGNFFLTLLAKFLSRLGDALIDAKTVLPWLLAAIGAPVAFIGQLVPIRESGSMLPQMFIAPLIRRQSLRKWVWVAGSVAQALAVLVMALIAVSLQGIVGGLALIGALLCFSLARGFCSIAAKDVLGKTIPKKRRGRIGGYSTAAAGVITLVVGTLLMLQPGQRDPFLSFLLAAAMLWLLAALVYAMIREQPGERSSGGNLWREGLGKIGLLKTDVTFRNLVITRSLLLASALSAPYYVSIARDHNDDITLLGMFVVATGAAGLLSGPVWGRLSDHSSRCVLVVTALLTAASGVAVFMLDRFWLQTPAWVFVLTFFVLAIIHNGVRLGRKTYVVDMAQGNKRTDYVATGNTLVGFILLLSGFVGFLAIVLDSGSMVLLLALAAALASVFALRLPEIHQ